MTLKYGTLETKASKIFDEKGVYKHFKTHKERVSSISSHRYLHLKEKELSVKLSIDNTGIHPESYKAAQQLQNLEDLSDAQRLSEVLDTGEAIRKDILKELGLKITG